MRDAFVRVLVALAEVDPTLVVADDIPWADDESLDVLAAPAPELATHRLAHHFDAGSETRRAVHYLRASARRAVSLHSCATADAFYRRASVRRGGGSPDRSPGRGGGCRGAPWSGPRAGGRSAWRRGTVARRSSSTARAWSSASGSASAGGAALNLANVLYVHNDMAGALDAHDRAGRIFRSLDDPRGVAPVGLNRGSVRHVLLGADDEAERDVVAALAYFEQVGDVQVEASCRDTLASLAIRRGELDVGAAHVARGRGSGCGQGRGAAPAALRRAAPGAGPGGRGPSGPGDGQAAGRVPSAGGTPAGRPGVARAGATGSRRRGGGRRDDYGRGRDPGDRCRPRTGHPVGPPRRPAGGRTPGCRSGSRPRRCQHRPRDARFPGPRDAGTGLRAGSAGTAPGDRRDRRAADPDGRCRVARDASRPCRAARRPRRGLPGTAPERGPVDPIERRRWLLAEVVQQVIEQDGAPTVADLAGILEVSGATVRRDLAALRGAGQTLPTRGAGAG